MLLLLYFNLFYLRGFLDFHHLILNHILVLVSRWLFLLNYWFNIKTTDQNLLDFFLKLLRDVFQNLLNVRPELSFKHNGLYLLLGSILIELGLSSFGYFFFLFDFKVLILEEDILLKHRFEVVEQLYKSLTNCEFKVGRTNLVQVNEVLLTLLVLVLNI